MQRSFWDWNLSALRKWYSREVFRGCRSLACILNYILIRTRCIEIQGQTICTFVLWLYTVYGREIRGCIFHRWGFCCCLWYVCCLRCWLLQYHLSVFLASKMLQWIFCELMTESCFIGRISRIYFVVNRLYTTVAVVVCTMGRLQMVF